MKRFQAFGIGMILASPGFGWPSSASGQGAPSRASNQTPSNQGQSTASLTLLQSLQLHPATAPYAFSTEVRGRQIVLRGRVGTKTIHDVAIRTAIGLGIPVVDELVIDTAAAHQVAAMSASSMSQGPGPGSFAGSGLGGSLPYTYPPPIFGRLDDPFFGFEPPLASFPPWWGAMSNYRLGPQTSPAAGAANGNGVVPTTQGGAGMATTSAPSDSSNPAEVSDLPDGTIDMAIDARGVATLRGVAPTLADRIAIGQQVAKTQGVTQVVNLLSVRPLAQAPGTLRLPSDTPPPLPTPYEPPAAQPRPEPAATRPEGPAIAPDGDLASGRISRTIAANPTLAGRAIKVKVRDGVASISGAVPTVYEAMLAYRSAQQTPGVREVDDHLEFVVPDGSGRNPLVEKGRPEDVEPYLEAQIKRQVGGLAHIDRLRVVGDSLEIRGTLEHAADRSRFDAILRSMPILRGFKVNAEMLDAIP